MSNEKIFITLFGCAAVTFLVKLLPYIIFGKKKEMPAIVKYLADYLPPAIMASLFVYCIKDVFVQSAQINIALFVAIAVTAIIHIYKRKTLFSITVGTIVYMILIR